MNERGSLVDHTQLVVLLGAPGSGKTTLGRLLGGRGWRFHEWELDLLEMWGSRENLIAHKTQALDALHQRVRDLAASPGPPVVYESTGLSDAEFLDNVVGELRTLVVRLDVSLDEARRRTRRRPRGEHLADDDAATQRIWNEFTATVQPVRPVDVAIDTEQVGLDRVLELVVVAVDAAARVDP